MKSNPRFRWAWVNFVKEPLASFSFKGLKFIFLSMVFEWNWTPILKNKKSDLRGPSGGTLPGSVCIAFALGETFPLAIRLIQTLYE